MRQQKIVGREQIQGKVKLGIQETSEMKNADNASQKTFKSHLHAGSNSNMQVQWIAERKGWILDNISKVFKYISNTPALVELLAVGQM